MSLPAQTLDFTRRRRVPRVALILLVLAAAALAWEGLAWNSARQRNDGLQARIEARQQREARAANTQRENPVLARTMGQIATALSTPWSQMLQDLETASLESGGEVALIAVEPDRTHGRVQLTAEARSLTAALAYLRLLQKRKVLSNSLLLTHEVQQKQEGQPVRVQIVADWSQRS
jgi:hypothetical protein